jgi:type IV pilus assembly protein PilA
MQTVQKLQKGFTLIELMIVVAIIGILAAVALPAYQDYIAKSKVTSIVATMSAGKSAMFDRYGELGEMPAAGTAVDQIAEPNSTSVGFWNVLNGANTGLAMANNASRLATGGSAYDVGDVGTGVGNGAEFDLTLDRVNGNINTKVVRFQYIDDGGSLRFECGKVNATDIPNKYLPKECQQVLASIL